MFIFALARFLVRLPKERRWMNRCQHPRCELRRQHFPALTRNAKTRAEDRLRRPLVKMTRLTLLRRLAHGRPAHRVGWPRRSRKFLVVGSHATIMNRNARAIRLHYFLCRLLKPNG